ncbi:MAG: type VI secretion system tube protein Hcp [Rhodoferax sp.]|nr:type VI secretion system tube protein Hcp [Rhodoferax sp.]
MTIDVYLQPDGIKGESSDTAHQGWIECTSAQWGVTPPKSATSSTADAAGGHTGKRCDIRRGARVSSRTIATGNAWATPRPAFYL